jgi:hypothetical protein
MDKTKLVVGQELWLRSGVYSCKGWVAQITPEGVDVQGKWHAPGDWSNTDELIHLDNTGYSYMTDPLMGWGIDERKHPEHSFKGDNATVAVGQNVRVRSGTYQGFGKVVKVVKLTPEGVVVRVVVQVDGLKKLLRFDKDGKGLDVDSSYECGPWCIDVEEHPEHKGKALEK